MGVCQSKNPAPDRAPEPEPEGSNSTSPPRSHLSSLSPSITLQTLLHRPNLADLTKVGAKVAHEGAHHLRNVFAKPLDMSKYQALPVYPKSEKEKEWLEEALRHNFVFENLPHAQIFPLVQAFEEVSVEAGSTIITQGEPGDYFYVLREGKVEFVTTTVVGHAEEGDSFGELALLYDAPRAATVNAITACRLYRVGQVVFRRALQSLTQDNTEEKAKLLEQVVFLKDLAESERKKLASVMTPKPFHEGELLLEKGKPIESFWIIYKGTVMVSDIDLGPANYENFTIGAGQTMGEGQLITHTPQFCNATALEDGMAFVIDKSTFETVLGDFQGLILRSLDRKKLAAIKIFQQTQLDSPTIASLSNFIVDHRYKKGRTIMNEGQEVEAGLYIVRKGRLRIVSSQQDEPTYVDADGYFGEDQLFADVKRGRNGPYDPTTTVAKYTVQVEEDVVAGVLTLAVCRKCLDTTNFGRPHAAVLDSLIQKQIPISELKKNKILGAGTFGQVWLVSRQTSKGEQRAYALKVQSKYELIEAGQARAVVHEKNIMAALHSPFLIQLVTTYKDEFFVYMLMGLVQGGELYALMHTSKRDGMSEKKAMFYLAGIAEGLGYMHRRGFVYRDLKPENVLIDNKGYPVIVDFGFAKLVVDKTYTLCGTPLYLAPEVILNRGHNSAADNWSLGVLMYEMIAGYTPFYKSGMDQSDLFKAIVRAKFHIPYNLSSSAADMVMHLLVKDPTLRLGSLAGGSADILNHAFLKGIDQDKLRLKELTAPFVPKIKNPLDASNFEDWSHLEDKMLKTYPPLPRVKEAIFENF